MLMCFFSGFNFNVTDSHGNTALHLAVHFLPDHLNITSRLINLGIDITARNSAGLNPIDTACSTNNLPILQTLLDNICLLGDTVDYLQPEEQQMEYTALLAAASSGHHEALQTLVANGINVNTVMDPQGG